MARISTVTGESVLSIGKWLGLNESPDGDTLLKVGEAGEMRNFRITRDGNLQKRPGYQTIHESKAWTGPIRGIWHGNVAGTEYTVFAAGGDIYSYDLEDNTAASILHSGVTVTDAPTTFFGFGEKLYMLNGHEYLEWDGTMPPDGGFAVPIGYRPLTAVSTAPAGGGTLLESVNKLNGLRRVRFSPNASAKTFQLPEKALASIDYVKNLVTGNIYVPTTDYTVDLTNGAVTFGTAPATGTNTIEIGYTFPTNFSSQIKAMKYAEIYNGAQDTRVFIYGDGTNRSYYSGLDDTGVVRADYFPDMNEMNVGAANTPITGMIRHYSSLAVFKTDSAYVVNYGQITLSTGALTAAFYINPTNRSIGNMACGQIQLVENNPRTLFNSAVYEWKNNASYSSNLTVDERQAKRISDRVKNSLSTMDLSSAVTYDDNERQEYYIIQGTTALVHNYAVDAWCRYTNFAFTALLAIGGRLYGCTPTGDIVTFSRDYYNDDGAEIDAYWQSGSMAFGRDYLRKYSGMIFVSLKPEPLANVYVTLMTNRKSVFAVKPISYSFPTFARANFAHWGFGTNTKPQTSRLKIKAKKFTYYQLVFETNTDWSTATILGADIKLRYGGDVK
ncbi:hypothetical protein SAMN02745823_02543 [Sporobacter termitidis DSM 10068]|uniref:Uncharacterized protein n=1 Tax=Sporobacter termitidis DSM 10068 TaxID=1123282 RepID=A0A1M5YHX3_9FIRM|nr:hypothetical protein [Sporobacter termitidis]SHI11469.1 hypothetical protein SAMN02745823_02543 [Sporobacter termitidis DSM 10068]